MFSDAHESNKETNHDNQIISYFYYEELMYEYNQCITEPNEIDFNSKENEDMKKHLFLRHVQVITKLIEIKHYAIV